MSSRINCHFLNLTDALEAFKAMGIPNFAIISERCLMFKHIADEDNEDAQMEGAVEAFDEFCKLLGKKNWEHLTCRVYEDASKGIKGKTDWDGSFNFRLNDPPAVADGNANNAILSKLTAMEKRLELMESDEPEENALGKIGEILEHPAILPIVAPLTARLMDMIFPEPKGVLTQVSGPTESGTAEDLLIAESIIRLKERVPDLGQVLAKMADMSERKPTQFLMYVGMIRAMR